MRPQAGKLHVVVWDINLDTDERMIDRVYSWHDWLQIPIEERPFATTMVRGKDELEVYRRALKGIEWFSDID